MKLVARILVGLLALGSLLLAASCWFNTGQAATQFGLTSNGLVGNATIRADIGGIFTSLAIFMGMAAWKQSRMWLLGALVAGGAAFASRVFGLLVDGNGPGVVQPMVVEIISLAILLWARSVWAKPAAA
jgi:hypothetical protein